MDTAKLKRIGKIVLKPIIALMLAGVMGMPLLTGGFKDLRNPFSYNDVKQSDATATVMEVLTTEIITTEQSYTVEDLLANVRKFVDTPEGGTPWKIFGETAQHEYSYTDEDGMEWRGVRPEFSDALKKMDGSGILIQGYMFPLGQEEKQPLFLLGPFPASCPYHYHVEPNLIIEVHAKTPVAFSYNAVNIQGTLELVPKDDQYNVFYRLNDAELVP